MELFYKQIKSPRDKEYLIKNRMDFTWGDESKEVETAFYNTVSVWDSFESMIEEAEKER